MIYLSYYDFPWEMFSVYQRVHPCITSFLQMCFLLYCLSKYVSLIATEPRHGVAAVKYRPVLHHCVVIFFWSSGIMECTCMLFTFENGVPLMRQGASVVWHHSLPLMNSFNKTEAAVFSCLLCFPRTFPFISLMGRMASSYV